MTLECCDRCGSTNVVQAGPSETLPDLGGLRDEVECTDFLCASCGYVSTVTR